MEIANLSFRYSERSSFILKNINIKFPLGKISAVIGSSGCGKSTLLRLIVGQLQPQIGAINFHHKPTFGVTFQDARLLPWLNARRNVEFAFGPNPPPIKEMRLRTDAALEKTGASKLASCYPSQLSGGQKQRINLARALVVNPTVLLLDEPFSALDRASRNDMHLLLKEILKNRSLTTILVTHDLEEAASLADEIIRLDGSQPNSAPVKLSL